MTKTKNEALELAHKLDALQLNMDYIPTQVVVAMDATALLLCSQEAEIKRLEYEIWNMKEMAKGYSNGS